MFKIDSGMSDSDTSVQSASSAVLRYGLAVASVAAALIVTLLLRPDALVTPIFFLAIILTAWRGGFGPGLLAALFATLAVVYFFLNPKHTFSFNVDNIPHLLVFFVSAFLISSWSASRRRAETLLRRTRDELENTVQERTVNLSQSNEQLKSEIAERKRAEESVREQASLLNLTHDTIFVRGINDAITYWNRGAEDLYGWKKEEAVGKITHDLLQTIFPAPIEAINEELLDSGRWQGEITHTKRDGTQVVVASRWSLKRDEQSRPEAVLETNNDITNRKLGEEKLRRSESYLAEAQRLSHTGSVGWSVLSGEIYWSEETYQIFEYDQAAKPTLESVMQRVHPDDRAFVQQTMDRAFNEGTSFDLEHRLLMPDDAVKHLHVLGHASRDSSGNLEVVGAVMDITATKQAEEAQRRSEEQWRDVFENNPTMYFMVDAGGKVLAVNPFGAQQLGYTVNDLIGQSVLSVFEESDRETVQTNLAVCLQQLGRATSWEARKVRRDGKVLWVRETAKAVSRVDGPIVLIACEDMTEKKRAEEALRKAQEELAHVTRVMTMGELVASIAHEVNQPLGAIVTSGHACVRLLSREVPDIDKSLETIGRMIKDGMRASEVIKRIRAILHKTPTEKAPLNINETIQEVIALVSSDVLRSKVEMRAKLALDLPPVAGDRIQLQQVILNLILNGKDAMSGVKTNPRELLITSRKSKAGELVVAVRDSGHGLDPADAERIFDPFFTTKAEGMGLGLSISRNIIEAHGGALWATPNEDRGATIQFTLPPSGT